MNGHMENQPRVARYLTPEWDRLIKAAEQIKFGELRVVLQNGKPVRIDAAIKQIRLDNEEDFRKGLETIPLT